MNIKKHIPNLLTCGNLFCGCLAITSAFKGDLILTAYLVGIAAVLDFFDGFVARLLQVGGELGKQLDSLADMVTFGVVPGVVMYHLLGHSWLGCVKIIRIVNLSHHIGIHPSIPIIPMLNISHF